MSLRHRVLERLLPHPTSTGQIVRFDGLVHSIEDSMDEDHDNDCPICWVEIGTRSSFRCVCPQVYHFSCIKSWIDSNHDECPICRRTLWNPSQYNAILQSLERTQCEEEEEMMREAHSCVDRGSAMTEGQNVEEAMACFNRAIVIYEQYSPGSMKLAAVYHRSGDHLAVAKRYQEAYDAYQNALPIYTQQVPQSDELADVHYNLSVVLKQQTKMKESIVELEIAIMIYEQCDLPDHLQLARCYECLGHYHHDKKQDTNRAIECYSKAIEQFDQSKPESLELATALMNIACLYCNMNSYPLAMESYQKALMILETHYNDSTELTSCYFDMGCILMEKGNELEAICLFKKALLSVQPESQTADCLFQIGICHDNMRDYPEAVEFYQRALVLYEKEDPMSTNVAWACGNICYGLGKMRRLQDAIEYGRRASQVLETKEDVKPSVLGMPCHKIGSAYSSNFLYQKALSYEKKALAFYEEEDSESVGTAGCLNNLGLTRMELGQLEESIQLLDRAALLFERNSSYELDRNLGIVWHNLGLARFFRGDYEEAIAMCQRSEDMMEKNSQSKLLIMPIATHIYVLTTLGNIEKAQGLVDKSKKTPKCLEPGQTGELLSSIGLLHAEQQEWQKAEECLRDAVSICKKEVFGSIICASIEVCLASVLAKRNCREEALSTAKGALQILLAEAKLSVRTARAHVVLGEIHIMLSNWDEAMVCFLRGDAILSAKAPRSVDIARVYCGIAEILFKRGTCDLAQEKWGEALSILHAAGASDCLLARNITEKLNQDHRSNLNSSCEDFVLSNTIQRKQNV